MKKPISLFLIITMLLVSASASVSMSARGPAASASGDEAAGVTAAAARDATSSSDQEPASPKEEAVYGILEHDGSVRDLYVVNIFDGGAITDYGSYSEIRNLTTSEELVRDGDKITINTAAEKFYYQGTLEKKDLPWNFTIKYFLDDRELSADELAGKSGRLKIAVSVRQNDRVSGSFFDNYALQVSLPLNSRLCSDIEAENAVIAEAGGKKQITWTVLPGKNADLTATANVRDFGMDPVTINGIRLVFGIEADTGMFGDRIAQLAEAVKELDSGAGELLAGLDRLSDGIREYTEGLKAFNEGIGQLSAGAVELDAGAAALRDGLLQMSNQNALLMSGAYAIQQATFDAVNARLKEIDREMPDLTPENYTDMLSQLSQMPGLSLVPGLSEALSDVKNQLDGVVQFTRGLENYTNGVAQLGAGAAELAKGTGEFSSSAAMLAASANELYKAGAQLGSAATELRDGLASYKAGMGKLREGTSGIDSEIEKEIDDLLEDILGSDEKPVSFVSEKNTSIKAVQFVLRTDPIKMPKTVNAAASETAQLTFWQRLLKLFGLYHD